MIFKIDPIQKYEQDILLFFDDVENQHRKAIKAVISNDHQTLKEVIDFDKKINEKHFLIFKNIFYGLARYHFFALSLRKVVAYSFINNELERLGDYASNICKLFLQKKINNSKIKDFIKEWENVIIFFSKVKTLFFSKDVEELSTFLFQQQKKKYGLKNLFQETQENKNDNQEIFFSKILIFNSLDRCQGHLFNIIEYLILILNFTNFKKIESKS